MFMVKESKKKLVAEMTKFVVGIADLRGTFLITEDQKVIVDALLCDLICGASESKITKKALRMIRMCELV